MCATRIFLTTAKSWQIILNVTGIPISISTSNGKKPFGKCSQPAVLHMYITLCWSSRFWPLKAFLPQFPHRLRRRPLESSRLRGKKCNDSRTTKSLSPWKIQGNLQIKHETQIMELQRFSQIHSNCTWMLSMPFAAPTIPWAWWRPGSRSKAAYLFLLVSWSRNVKHWAKGSEYDLRCKTDNRLLLSFLCSPKCLDLESDLRRREPLRSNEADSMLMISKFWPDDLLFSKLLPLWFCMLLHKETQLGLYLLNSASHVTFGPSPSLHSPNTWKRVWQTTASAISNLPSSSSYPKYLLLSGFLSLWGHRNSNFLAQDVCLAFLSTQ